MTQEQQQASTGDTIAEAEFWALYSPRRHHEKPGFKQAMPSHDLKKGVNHGYANRSIGTV